MCYKGNLNLSETLKFIAYPKGLDCVNRVILSFNKSEEFTFTINDLTSYTSYLGTFVKKFSKKRNRVTDYSLHSLVVASRHLSNAQSSKDDEHLLGLERTHPVRTARVVLVEPHQYRQLKN